MTKKNSQAPKGKTPAVAAAPQPTVQEMKNSYSQLAANISNVQGFPFFGAGGSQVSQTDTMWLNNRWYLISNQRQLLSEMYVEHGIVQTLVDQPVDDAFRSGFEIKSSQLDGNDIELLENYLERHRVIEVIKQSCKWSRLFGGGATLVIVDQKPDTPLNIKAIKESSKLSFRAVDMWELYNSQVNMGEEVFGNDENNFLMKDNDRFYDYYGFKLHDSRVLSVKGKEPPSLIRPRLRGWGLSELEKIVRTFNQYLKNQNVVFELLDEAKIDVFKIDGLNSSLASAMGTEHITSRVQLANMIKSYLNALTMDTKDEYEQKQMTFTGLGEMLVQIRQGVAADLKMPITKLFGISAAGFSSGEDDIENYNSMVESEVRSKIKFHLIDVIGICCQKLFGFVPKDLAIEWKALRVMSALEEEQIKNHQFNRVTSSYQSGAIDRPTWAKSVNKASLLPIEIDEAGDGLPPLDGQFNVPAGDNVTK